MERLFGGTDKIILDSGGQGSGVVPYLPLDQLTRPQAQRPGAQPQTTTTPGSGSQVGASR